MQANRPPDRRPMSRGNKLLILFSLGFILLFGGLTLYPVLQDRLPRQTAVPPSLNAQTADPGATIATIDEALSLITPTLNPTSVLLLTQPPAATPAPNYYMTPTPSDVPTLKKGSSGDDVRTLQLRLIALGYLRTGANDGVYGTGTQNAVRAFQQANGLGVDGSAGPMTLQKLFSPDAVAKQQ